MLVVLNDGNGQMCNKLLFQANILASSYQNKYPVCYYRMEKFPGFKQHQKELERNLIRKDNEPKLQYALTRLVHKTLSKISLSSKKFVMVGANNQDEAEKLIRSNYLQRHTSYLYGWPFYDLDALREAGDLVREYLSPEQDVEEYVSQQKKKLNDLAEIIIGVHLRRGDYKTWRNGAYYYSNAEYVQCMNSLFESLHTTKKCCFVLFSNEKLDITEFENDNYLVIKASGSAAQDFHLMSQCNYLVGPPSSFSGLASFLGKVPRYMIENPKKVVEKSDMLIWLEETDSWGRSIKEV